MRVCTNLKQLFSIACTKHDYDIIIFIVFMDNFNPRYTHVATYVIGLVSKFSVYLFGTL